MADYTGSFELDSQQNYDNFLTELGVGPINRRLMQSTKPVIEFTVDEAGQWVITNRDSLRTRQSLLKLGEEFTETRVDELKVTSLITREGDELTHIQTPLNGGNVVKKVYDLKDDDTLTITASVGNVTSVLVFKRV
ncbi:lipocalin/fatty-acid binding family protein [Streptomyces sp. B-S-A8]|uniref:Lipocalin/fatty-acid binding family protein n=1 Tax=Streptomyces solicavernae TaxID=3043614 RepID=A0ABT6RZZ4_9ACTN|nr:lipocalin/fatty-acid binding family protein [Streptomyces sp. B-S-A8]MDI3390019.1 lipocalin/fatty-acid binding family protein [Streptomyces sp. B-S-A8]